jgi:glycosyltransferase involved in cell wall biosynthesis
MKSIAMLLSNSFKPDPRVLKEAEHLQKAGYQLTVFCWDRASELPPEETLSSGVNIIRIHVVPSSYGIGTRQLGKLIRFWKVIQPHLQKVKPDYIHCHDFDTLPAGLWYGKFHHLPVIYDAHEYYSDLVKPRLKGIVGSILYRLIRLAEHICASHSNAIITVDDTLARIYQNFNTSVIVLGHYPIKELASQVNPVFSRPSLSMIYAGRLSVDRGLLIYVDLLRRLLDVGIPAHLVLAGTYTPEQDKLRFIGYAQDVKIYIADLGWIPYQEMSQLYRSSDIGLSILLPEPRYIAAVPVKLFEYMACGLPVVASNFPATSAIINEADCGILVDPTGDLTEPVQKIKSWWNDRSEPSRLGENGRHSILTKYNWENQIQRLLKLYQELP